MKMICWFCSLREAQVKHTYGIDMYGEVDAKTTPAQTDVAYRVRHVDVPRCADCHRRHRLARFVANLSVLFFIAAIAAMLAILLKWTTPLISGIWLGLAVGLTLAALIAAKLILKGIHSLRKSHKKYPEIQDLLKQGYRFGQRPKAGIPKADPPRKASDEGTSSNT